MSALSRNYSNGLGAGHAARARGRHGVIMEARLEH